MAAPRGRDAVKADKEADVIVQSLRSAGEAAVATTLAGICDVLKNNRPLLYHISALLHNPEWKGVLLARAMGENEGPESPGGPSSDAKQPGVRKLRVGIKKFEQLLRTA
jgi:hypothetical protein